VDDATLAARLRDSMRHFYRLLGRTSPGGQIVEREGVLACIVPVAPERSYPNAVLYERVEALEAAYEGLAKAYRDAGVRAWTVWIPEQDRSAAELLQRRGHLLDASPTAMARELDGIQCPAPGTLGDWTSTGDPALVGALNDRAYPFGDDTFAAAFGGLAGEGVRLYVGRLDGQPSTCLVTTDLGENCEIDGVATPPELRGHGLSGQLLAHALVDAAERGCTTTTLVATSLGRPVYERLGYRPLGTLQMWERRTS
jgi:predicted GNAT family acetyltransferase